jgi:ABC-type phosphate transport system substrate-binding protein
LNARLAPSSAATLQTVRQDPNAIAYVSFSLVDDSVRVIAIDDLLPTTDQDSAYPLHTPLFIVGNGEPEAAYRAFIAWIQSDSGQSIVARHYRPLPN